MQHLTGHNSSGLGEYVAPIETRDTRKHPELTLSKSLDTRPENVSESCSGDRNSAYTASSTINAHNLFSISRACKYPGVLAGLALGWPHVSDVARSRACVDY